ECLCNDAKHDEGYERIVIKHSHRYATQKPQYSVGSIERTEGCTSLVHRHNLRDAGTERCILRAQTSGPTSDANINASDTAQETKWKGQQRNDDSDYDDLNSKSIEKPTEDERRQPIQTHRSSIEQRNEFGTSQRIFLKVKCEQRKIHKAKREQSGRA